MTPAFGPPFASASVPRSRRTLFTSNLIGAHEPQRPSSSPVSFAKESHYSSRNSGGKDREMVLVRGKDALQLEIRIAPQSPAGGKLLEITYPSRTCPPLLPPPCRT